MDVIYGIVGILAMVMIAIVVLIPFPDKENKNTTDRKSDESPVKYRPNVLYTSKTLEEVKVKPEQNEDARSVVPVTELEILAEINKAVSQIAIMMMVMFVISAISILVSLWILLG